MKTKTLPILDEIAKRLKDTPEQKKVVGPIVAQLVEAGWNLDQIIFGKNEWRVPKSPSEATKREKHASFSGFPVDIAVFDDPRMLKTFQKIIEYSGLDPIDFGYAAKPRPIMPVQEPAKQPALV